MTDLYGLLGLDRAATRAQIRAAYRRAAKVSHPDAGGDPAVWRRLKLAHDVLTDVGRRAAYDLDGGVAEPQPDGSFGRMVDGLNQCFEEVLKDAMQRDRDLGFVDVVAALRAKVRGRRLKILEFQQALDVGERVLRRVEGRFATDGEQNVLEGMVQHRLSEIADRRRGAVLDLAAADAAEALLAGFSYRVDRAPGQDHAALQTLLQGLGQRPSWVRMGVPGSI